MRARVTSSREGSGNCGENRPSCTLPVLPGSRCERNANNRGMGWMRFQIEMKQLDPELFVVRWQRRPNGARVRRAAVEVRA